MTSSSEVAERPDLSTVWRARLEPAVCEQCDWRYLLPGGSAVQRCPHCFRGNLSPLTESSELEPFPHPPELLLPFAVEPQDLATAVESFSDKIPLSPVDLKPAILINRLRRVYLPLWLVDAEVQAQFRADFGYDYEVVSHQERYAASGWQTQEVRETRIRWELRLGRLLRKYQNIPAPALEEEAVLRSRLGAFQLAESVDYEPKQLSQTFVHLPDRPPADAWSDAELGFLEAVTQECVQAAEAQHVREFQWSAEFADKHWTQLLRPLYTTYYSDDEGQPRPVWINGQTGRLYGQRRSSMKRARRMALYVAIGGAGFFLLAVLLALAGLLAPIMFVPALVLAAIGLILLAGAVIPLMVAWNFNRGQAKQAIHLTS